MLVGILLIGIGWYGIPSFELPNLPGFQMANQWSDNFNDDLIDASKWDIVELNGATVTERNGYLEVTTIGEYDSMAGLRTRMAYDLTACEIAVDVFSRYSAVVGLAISPTSGVPTRQPQEEFYIAEKNLKNQFCAIRRWKGGVDTVLYSDTWTSGSGSLKIVIQGGSITFYEEENARCTETFMLASYNCYVTIYARGTPNNYGIDYLDNFELSSAQPEPPPSTGTLNVKTYVDGAEISAILVSLTWPDGSTHAVTTPYTLSPAQVGTYYAQATYNGVLDSDSVYVGAGQTKTIQLSWGSTPPPPPPDGDGGGSIIDFLNQPMFRYAYLGLGIFCMVWAGASIGLGYRKPRQPT